MEMNEISLTTNGTVSCSGNCTAYCIAASTAHYHMGVDHNKIEQDCRRVDDLNYKEANFDFNALEKTLDNFPFKKDGNIHVCLWGADPITAFQCLQEEVEFLEWWAQKNNRKVSISSSTNGYPLLRNDVCEYLKQHNVLTQLSYDGIGQWMRTGEIDPLEFDNVKMLMKEGILNCINLTLNQYNYSIAKNIYFMNDKLKSIFPDIYDKSKMASEEESKLFKTLYIKMNHIYDGEYNSPVLNKEGRWQDTIIEELKNTPIGDLSFHNGTNKWDKHVLDDYIAEWLELLYQYCDNGLRNVFFMPYRKYIIDQFKRGRNLKNKWGAEGNPCRQWQIGAIDYSYHIDTMGKFSDCNLIDGDTSVKNRSNDREKYCNECKDCKYTNSAECNMCGAMIPRAECEYYYRWNQFLDLSRKVMERNFGNNYKS